MVFDTASSTFSTMPPKATAPRVEMRHVFKRFGDVQALDDAEVSFACGEVHALLGENGAGKTTLMNVLSGLYRADASEVFINGQKVDIRSPADAAALNICMVHQHFELISNFTALENIILAVEGGQTVIDVAAKRKEIQELMPRYGLSVALDSKVKALAIGIQQKTEILKALYRGASILILDEPTTMLTPQESDALFSTIGSFTKQGLTVVLITHKIKEVLAVSNRVTVMRRGKLVRTICTADASEQLLVELMMGEKSSYQAVATHSGRRVDWSACNLALSIEHLGVRDDKQCWVAEDVSIEVARGEMVGLVGVAGNGQREVAEAIYGVRKARTGKITVGGKDITRSGIKDRLKAGVAFIPEDRIRQGILPTMPLADTLVLGPHHFLFGNAIIFDSRKVDRLGREAIREYQIKAPDERIATCLLSGGNIQKVIIARAFLLSTLVNLELIIAFSPTRGLDVMSTRFIHSKLVEVTRACGGVLLISEDLDESMLLCDRIYAMHGGRVAGEFDCSEYDPYAIGAVMVGEILR